MKILEQYISELEQLCDEAIPNNNSDSAIQMSVVAQAKILIETPNLLRIIRGLTTTPLSEWGQAEQGRFEANRSAAERILNEKDET